jgi:two-component system cell cycle sensor histidine kinase/response regulator CckA
MKILSVDDLAENRYLLEFMLRSAGHEVLSVADGQAALDAALRERFDLVVSDVLMPRMDGFQLCRELKARPETRAIPFVFYTATYTDDRDRDLGLSLGAARYVLKPQEPQSFLREIRDVVEETVARPPDPPRPVAPEEEFLVAYKQTLVRKLDAKVAELRASEATLAAAQRLARVGSWELRAPEGQALEGVEVKGSAELARLLGAEGPRTVGELLQAIPGASRGQLDAALRAARKGETPQTLEHELARPDGSRIRALTRIEAGPAVGTGTRHLLGVTQDVTERRRLEEVARQAQKMETLGRMAAGIAHDFNNVLSAILLNAEGLLGGTALAGDDRAAVEEMVQAGERAAQLTRQLLTFAQRRALLSQRCDLRAVVEGMVAMLRRIIGKVSLECRLGDTALPVQADPNMLEQVVMNLVVNARDAMPQGGQVVIEVGRVEVEPGRELRVPGARPGPALRLVVSDAGTGIPSEHLSRLFDPFFTTKAPGKGTGLGLATVYGIVRRHHGWVEVDSDAGKGSRFEVYLPPADTLDVSGHAAKPGLAPAASRGERVMLVEDDAAVRSAAVRHLRQVGYQVAEASSAEAALTALEEAGRDSLDLLVTDLLLPGKMDGVALARRLREDRAGLRVLFVTGYGGEAVEGLVAGEAALLAKPLTPARLERAVRQCLDEPS